jgi:hypothetical protein
MELTPLSNLEFRGSTSLAGYDQRFSYGRPSSMEPQVLRSISRRLEKGQSMLLAVPESGRYLHIVIADRRLIHYPLVATAAYAL